MKSKNLLANEGIRCYRKEDFFERMAVFVWGCLVYAISFSVFFSPLDIVTGGTTGLSLIVREIMEIDTSLFVFLFSSLTLVIGFFLLGIRNTIRTLMGVILFPILLEFGSVFQEMLEISDESLFLNVFFGGLLMGLGNGLIIRSGFSVGGFQTIYQIFYKYFGVSIGKSTLFINGILIFFSSFFFGISRAMYAVIGIYISSVVTDKVMLETSISKTFYIVTNKEKEISQYIVEVLGYGATIMEAKGGYSNDKKKIVMCAIPTRQYYMAKEVMMEIDPGIFFLIVDTYEVCGGV